MKYFPAGIFPHCIAPDSICLAPGAIIYKFTPSNPDYAECLVWMTQRISKSNIRACTMTKQDHLVKLVCLADIIGICQERFQTVMAIPVRTPAAARLKAHDLTSIIN